MALTVFEIDRIERQLIVWREAKVVGQRELKLIEMALELVTEVKRLRIRK